MNKAANHKQKTAVIVGAGDFADREWQTPYDLLIAADGGLAAMEAKGLTADVIVGDFDSLGYRPDAGRASEVIALPCEKDDTDMKIACQTAWERGCRSLRIYGGTGDRPDHFLANLQLGAWYSRLGADIRLIAPAFTVFFLTDGQLQLTAETGCTFSVFSHTDRAQGVSISGGAKYTLQDRTLLNTDALGVSNVMTGEAAEIAVRQGTLLIILYLSPEAAG